MSLLEHNVFELLDVPAGSCKDLEAVSENSDLVEMSYLDFAQLGVSDNGGIDPVELVDDTFVVKLLDHADGLLTNGSFSLLSACTAVMSAIDSSVLCDGVHELASLSSGLTIVDIGANPEVRARLELGEKSFLVNNVSARSVNEHGIWLHLSEEFGVDHTLGLGSRGSVDADDVRAGEELVLAHIGEAKLLIQTRVHGTSADEHVHLESLGSLENKL